MTRTPLQTVPIQKKSKKLASEDLLLKKLGNARLAAGLHGNILTFLLYSVFRFNSNQHEIPSQPFLL